MSSLPEDIIFNNILSRLPVKSLFRFRCVRKSWCEFFRNPNFIKMHLNHHANENNNNFSIMLYKDQYHFDMALITTHVYTKDYDPLSSTCGKAIELNYPLGSSFERFQIWGSCNGLFCISCGLEKFIILWNPYTKEYKELPAPPFETSRTILHYFEHGFGYDCEIDDYKVVTIVRFGNQLWSEVMVYTLGSNSWRSLKRIPYAVFYKQVPARGRVTVNGAVHWLATSFMGSEQSKVILCFDVVNERFKEMPLPKGFIGYNEYSTFVTVLGGALCLLNYVRSVRLDIWVMKDYGVIDSWTKLYTIDQQTSVGSFKNLMPVQSFSNGGILLVKEVKDSYALVLYDQENETATTLDVLGDSEWVYFHTCIFVGSLVSLNTGTYAKISGGYDPTQEAYSSSSEEENHASNGDYLYDYLSLL